MTHITQRTLSQRWIALATSVVLLTGVAGLTSCSADQADAGDTDAAFPASGTGEVNILNMTNFVSPAALEKFTKETGITTNVDTASSTEEIAAKIKAGSATYDVVMVVDFIVEDLIAGGHLAELNVLDWPNGKNIEEDYIDVYSDKGRKYTAPYAQVYQGIGLDPTVVKEPVTSWADYFSGPPSAVGEIGLHDGQTFVVDAALIAVGAEPCTKDGSAYQRALDLLLDFKPKVKIISSDGTIDRLAGGEVVLSSMWNGSFARAQSQTPQLEYVFPSDGFLVQGDNWAQLTNAKNPDNAKIFINWMLDPVNAALNADFIKYSAPIKGIEDHLAPISDGNAPVMLPTAEELKLATVVKPCAPEQREQYDKVWTSFKN